MIEPTLREAIAVAADLLRAVAAKQDAEAGYHVVNEVDGDPAPARAIAEHFRQMAVLIEGVTDVIDAYTSQIADAEATHALWYQRMAEIREASGIGNDVMLSEIPLALAELWKMAGGDQKGDEREERKGKSAHLMFMDMIETLQRLVDLTPQAANVSSADRMHHVVRAIAASALDRLYKAAGMMPDLSAEIERIDRAAKKAVPMRFVAVRWYLPGLPSIVQVYDRECDGDIEAWKENGKIGYPQAIIGMANDRTILLPSSNTGMLK